MKKMIQICVAVVILASVTGCASSKAYFVDRGRDAADIFTATMGIGAGAKARVGPLHVGLLANMEGYGLRGGIFGRVYDPYREGAFVLDVDTFGMPIAPWDGSTFGFETSFIGDERSKDFFNKSPIPFVYIPHSHHDNWIPENWTLIEVVVAAGPSLRLGFNPGELLDFILGLTALDIYGDDLEMEILKEESNQSSASQLFGYDGSHVRRGSRDAFPWTGNYRLRR